MRREFIIGIAVMLLLAGCAGPITNTSPPGTDTPGDSKTSAGHVEEITVRYMDSFTEANKERPTMANHTTELSFTIGQTENRNDEPEPQGYTILNTANTPYTVDVKVTHGKAILETRSVRLSPGEDIEITMFAPSEEPTQLAYRTTITAKMNGNITSRLRIITPAESFDCNMKGVDVIINDNGRTSAHKYSSLAACKDTFE